MNVAFVYAQQEIDKDQLLQEFRLTRLDLVDHVILFDTGGADDLQEFHEQVAAYTEDDEVALVAIHGLDVDFMRRVVFELIAKHVPVVFELTATQRVHLLEKHNK